MELRVMTPGDASAVAELGIQLGCDIDASSVEGAISRLAGASSLAIVSETDGGIVGWVHRYVTVLTGTDGREDKVRGSADLIVENGVPQGNPTDFVDLKVTEIRR